MAQSIGRPPTNEPPDEAPMPTDPRQDPIEPEDPQRDDPSVEPASPEMPDPEDTPEDPLADPFDNGNFPI